MTAVRPFYLPAPYQDSTLGGRLILRDGSTATIRLSRTEDRTALQEFFAHLSPESRRMRFFSETKPGIDVIESLCGDNAPGKQMTFVVTRITDRIPRIVATGSYIAHSGHTAEFAVAVDDAFQGKGLGGLILERLSVLAASQGFVHFIAITDASNRAMLDVFRSSGFESKEAYQDGYVQVDLSLAPQERSVAHSELRDRLFTKTSMRAVLSPRSVAVVTATADPSSPGLRALLSLRDGGFNGSLCAITRDPVVIGGIRAFSSLREMPGTADLAILDADPGAVLDLVDDCAERGVRALLVLSGGFADAGDAGRAHQQRLVEKVRGYGMRLVGPNSFGVVNTDPDVRLNASLAHRPPMPGHVAISSQSGSVGMALLDLAHQRRVGVSMFVSMGNKADVTGNDLLQTWEDDPNVAVILLYLESFGNPRRFARIARRVSGSKPIVCVKSGRAGAASTDRDAVAAALRSSDTAVNALFRQAGVIRADTLEHMFDLAALLARQPLPKGRRVAIVTNSHGAGVLCADAARSGRLEIASLDYSTTKSLAEVVAPASSFTPVVDLTSAALPDHYRAAVEHALLDNKNDAVLALYAPVSGERTPQVLEAIREGMAAARSLGATGKTVAAVLLSSVGETGTGMGGDDVLPIYSFPENAARALSAAADYAEWRSQPPGLLVDFDDARPLEVREICRKALEARGAGWLEPEEAAAVLRAFGVPALGPTGTPLGAVAAEVMVGVTQDPSFGPLVAFGLAGLPTDVLQDVCFRITPLTERDAEDMVREVRAHPLLEGIGGRQPADIPAIVNLLTRVSLLVEEVPEIQALELSPVAVYAPGEGCSVRQARVRVGPADSRLPATGGVAAPGAKG